VKILLIAGLFAFESVAQTITEPPVIVQLIRRAGIDTTSNRAYEGRAAVNVFGMTSITGPAETWHIEAHNSFGSIEEINQSVHSITLDREPADRFDRLSGALLAQSRTLIAIYRPGFSYRPDQAARMLPRTRYFSVTLYRIRPGADGDFSELLKARKDFFDSINLDRPEIAYQIISGAPAATYLLLTPLTSLSTLDEGLGRRVTRSESRPAGAANAGNKSGSDIELSRSQLLFRVQPQLSYVSDEVASEAPEFWRQKPVAQ
jgi:hypothetical protein